MTKQIKQRFFSRYTGNHMRIRYNGELMDWRTYERRQGQA